MRDPLLIYIYADVTCPQHLCFWLYILHKFHNFIGSIFLWVIYMHINPSGTPWCLLILGYFCSGEGHLMSCIREKGDKPTCPQKTIPRCLPCWPSWPVSLHIHSLSSGYGQPVFMELRASHGVSPAVHIICSPLFLHSWHLFDDSSISPLWHVNPHAVCFSSVWNGMLHLDCWYFPFNVMVYCYVPISE